MNKVLIPMTGLALLLVGALLVPGCGEETTCTPTGLEQCGDFRDNDCDGLTDEDCSGVCTVGQQRGCGATPNANVCAQTCDSGAWGPCRPISGTGQEVCGDNLDNNCNNQIDEYCANECTENQIDYCGGSPTQKICQRQCKSGQWTDCRPTTGNPGIEVCGDNLDNDCDGFIDDGCDCTSGDTQDCGGSPAAKLCWKQCVDGKWGDCVVRSPNTGVEICDTYDNNCDGRIDENCDCANGEVAYCGGTPDLHTCKMTCSNGTWSQCLPTAGGTPTEICGDSADNDCNGQVDERKACTNSCGTGFQYCEGDAYGPCKVDGAACDPSIPEKLTEACTGSTVGICTPGYHEKVCQANCQYPTTWSDCKDAIVPNQVAEFCNCLDDDCDGNVDDGIVCTGDNYGDNHDQCRAVWLGTDPNTTITPRLVQPELCDFFSFSGKDEDLSWGEDIKIRLTNIPAGSDFDLYLYRYGNDLPTGEEDHTSCGSLDLMYDYLKQSANPPGESNNRDEAIDFEEGFGDNDTATYLVVVCKWADDPGGCYTLKVDGLD